MSGLSLLTGAAVLMGTLLSVDPAAAQAPPAGNGNKPNLVFILMDNLGYGEPGVYGGGITRGAPTPRIDQLATEGMRLTNFNVEAQCTPSRSAIMTGGFPIRSGVISPTRSPKWTRMSEKSWMRSIHSAFATTRSSCSQATTAPKRPGLGRDRPVLGEVIISRIWKARSESLSSFAGREGSRRAASATRSCTRWIPSPLWQPLPEHRCRETARSDRFPAWQVR